MTRNLRQAQIRKAAMLVFADAIEAVPAGHGAAVVEGCLAALIQGTTGRVATVAELTEHEQAKVWGDLALLRSGTYEWSLVVTPDHPFAVRFTFNDHVRTIDLPAVA